jgi:predicted amidohydrolase
MPEVRIALAQVAASTDPAANLTMIRERVAEAAERGARVVVFPEATMARFGIPLGPVAEPLDGAWASAVSRIAEEAGLAVVAGMFTPAPDGRVRNTLLITGRGLRRHYDKVHLYDAHGFAESKTVEPGDAAVTFDLDGVRYGVATCYDVRFPALFRHLASAGASVILMPASWGAGEGKREQWEVLVRARALDSTSWVVACDQADPAALGTEPGKAPTGIGDSLVVGPTGGVHAQAGAGVELLVTEVDTGVVDTTREALPVLANARKFC